MHLDDAVAVHRGRTSLRDEADPSDYQLGLSKEAQKANPTEPVDGDIEKSDAPTLAND